MREALAGLIHCAFGPMGVRRLEAEVDIRNAAAAGLLQRLGFVREGLLRRQGRTQGRRVVLLRDEWPGHPNTEGNGRDRAGLKASASSHT